ncbi:AAA family ATPase [Planctomicrobium sp. SH664]|uniref:AAA family ATPase n=1 Tax=Planctomicrobium sp. SH664 TaxID=3448125 RepID=UPI003F5C392C
MNGNETVNALRAAIIISPDNLPLRQHLAATLASLGRYQEAETEYRSALASHPQNAELKLGLAEVYAQQGRTSHALVVVEDLVKAAPSDGRVFILYARLLADTGDVTKGASMYRRGVEQSPEAADTSLAERLGVDLTPAVFQEADEADGLARAAWEAPVDPDEHEIERPKIDFAAVGGMESVKEQIRLKIIHPLQHPQLYAAYGKTIGGGILLYGPPGCGKTHLARATAGEIKSAFLSIGINDVLDMFIGNSEKNLHELFEQARRAKPCVLFFDEVDALGSSRSDMKHSGGRQLVNQFLAELDGIESQNDGVLVLAATNAPWQLDGAFRRPGRFDRIIFVPPPDQDSRAEILRILCLNKPLDRPDFVQLAKKTEGFSGADLKAVVDVAIEGKLQEALRAGVPQPISTKDLLAAVKAVKPSTRDWFASARNYALYSNQSGLYDDILRYLKIQ